MYSEKIERRLDPHFYSPEFSALLKLIDRNASMPLGNLIEFSSETWDQENAFQDEFPYIEISGINIHDGEIEEVTYLPVKKAPSRAKMIVRQDDIIVSTTRPHRGAIALIDAQKDGVI